MRQQLPFLSLLSLSHHLERLVILFSPTLGYKNITELSAATATGILPAELHPAALSVIAPPSPIPFCASISFRGHTRWVTLCWGDTWSGFCQSLSPLTRGGDGDKCVSGAPERSFPLSDKGKQAEVLSFLAHL